MVLTIGLLLALGAFLVAIASAMGKAPLWVAVLLLAVLALLKSMPL